MNFWLETHYPTTIVRDRYNGTYSGAEWLAFPLDYWNVPDEVDGGDSDEEDLDRIYTLRDMGYLPYVMIYRKNDAPRIYSDLQRWVNNKIIFAKCKRFEDYRK